MAQITYRGAPMRPLLPHDPARIGRYEIEARLGAGGMGVVYLGRTPGGRPAAVKVIGPGYLEQPDALERFRREVETLHTIRNAYTAALIDYELPYWFATEYVPGPTLAGPLPATECRALMAALAEALADIHAHGICHRDVKPQNVILSPTGPRLIDFGIARGLAETGLTNSGLTVGTPGYTAPELFNGDPLSPASDVFALGATLAHAATARKPFGTGTLEAIWMRSMQEDIDLDGVDPQLSALIRWCVTRDPEARPAPAQIIEWCRQWKLNTLTTPLPEAPKRLPAPSDVAGRRGAHTDGASSGSASDLEAGLQAPVATPLRAGGPAAPLRSRRALVLTAAILGSLLLFAGGAVASRQLLPQAEAPAAVVTTQSQFPLPYASQPSPARPTPSPSPPSPAPTASKAAPSASRPSARPTETVQPRPSTPTTEDGRCIQLPPEDGMGAKVSAARCTGVTGQRWTFTRQGALQYPGTTRCLDIGGNAGADLADRIQLWECNYGKAQLWVPQPSGALFNARSGKCLGILPTGPLSLQTCTDTPSQLWRLP